MGDGASFIRRRKEGTVVNSLFIGEWFMLKFLWGDGVAFWPNGIPAHSSSTRVLAKSNPSLHGEETRLKSRDGHNFVNR